jgi:hypothetical protein
LDLSPKETIKQMVMVAFPTTQHVPKTDPQTGRTTLVPATDANGQPIQSRQAVEARDALIKELDKLQLPEAALDQVINYFQDRGI